MRLGFHYHIPAIKKNDLIYMPGYLGRFVDSLASHCDKVLCFMHTPMPDEEQEMDYALHSRNVELVSLGVHSSLPRRVLGVRNVMRALHSSCDQLDALLIRGPSPLLPWVAKACRSLPIVLLLVGDQLAGVDDLPQPRWRKEAIRTFWRWNNWQQLNLAKRSLTFVNSHLLYQELEGKVQNLVETRTTTLEESDFYVRDDTCLDRPVRLLYTGRMDPAKGLLEMVEALSILVKQGEDVVIDFVGWPEKGSTILEQIQQFGFKNQVADRIFFHGYKPVGSELFAFYKHADIYLIASQSSEGFPRTIWEAMAHSLPVVATKVGSIPDFIEGAAVIIEPHNIASIADAIKGLINDPKKRQLLIRMGQKLARENTLDRRSREMMSVISNHLKTLRNDGKSTSY